VIYDDAGAHLADAGSFERAAVPLGMYVAWCAQHQLLSDTLVHDAADLLLRVRFREINGSELLVAGCAGRLGDEHLNATGQAFTGHYYPRYMDDFRAEFGDDVYAVRDDWVTYDRIAARLTAEFMAYCGRARGRARGRGRSGATAGWLKEVRKWWKS
jgi:hypothetical protein